MQTWAKRGVHAALVTGGMLAVGSGVASASGTCPVAPAPSARGAVPPIPDRADDGTPRRSGQCFSGELFPGESRAPSFDGSDHRVERHASHAGDSRTAFTGTIDPVRDVLPVIENETTREIPVVDDATTPLPTVSPGEQTVPMLELAGWVAEPSTAIEHPAAEQSAAEQPRGKHAQRLPGTPSDGFQRSLSWMGAIGGVLHDFPAGTASSLDAPDAEDAAPGQDRGTELGGDPTRAATDSEASPEPAFPTSDPVEQEDVPEAAGLVELWDGVLGRASEIGPAAGGGLLEVGTDLTSGELPGPGHSMHRIPPALLAASLTTVPRPPVPRQEGMPLRVPGEALAKAAEIPPLNDLVLRGEALGNGALGNGVLGSGVLGERSRAGSSDRHAASPHGGELHAADGGDVSVPVINRIVEALSGRNDPTGPSAEVTQPIPMIPAFTDTPLRSLVEVIFLDDLTAAIPELQQVTSDPFRVTAIPRAEVPQVMDLPLLDDELLGTSAFQGEALSTPLHDMFSDLEDTVVLERI